MASGKSKLAVDLIKNKKNSLYLTLDNDFSLIKELKKSKIEYNLMKNCLLMDLKYRVLERGGLLNNDLEYVVVDSINKISDKKSYNFKIKYLLEVEKDFNIKIISTINVLKINKNLLDDIKNIDNVKLIEVKYPI